MARSSPPAVPPRLPEPTSSRPPPASTPLAAPPPTPSPSCAPRSETVLASRPPAASAPLPTPSLWSRPVRTAWACPPPPPSLRGSQSVEVGCALHEPWGPLAGGWLHCTYFRRSWSAPMCPSLTAKGRGVRADAATMVLPVPECARRATCRRDLSKDRLNLRSFGSPKLYSML